MWKYLLQIPGVGISKMIWGKYSIRCLPQGRRGKGTECLGLSISYGIVKMHDGSIEVESEIGKGTIFRIFLPLETKKRTKGCMWLNYKLVLSWIMCHEDTKPQSKNLTLVS